MEGRKVHKSCSNACNANYKTVSRWTFKEIGLFEKTVKPFWATGEQDAAVCRNSLQSDRQQTRPKCVPQRCEQFGAGVLVCLNCHINNAAVQTRTVPRQCKLNNLIFYLSFCCSIPRDGSGAERRARFWSNQARTTVQIKLCPECGSARARMSCSNCSRLRFRSQVHRDQIWIIYWRRTKFPDKCKFQFTPVGAMPGWGTPRLQGAAEDYLSSFGAADAESSSSDQTRQTYNFVFAYWLSPFQLEQWWNPSKVLVPCLGLLTVCFRRCYKRIQTALHKIFTPVTGPHR